ncbi:peptidylprolyl isomerase [Gammaproteobacteria bacterium AB-CW1]|uniref:Chaperone SurA n=1 Tax=Natronospira elongata TaxID=3110268 RepID=A0AAP6MMM2_9GAMM|nr:peptidylprolyl isomerase [Gammaproteobacteria bacterium AB-CW1]
MRKITTILLGLLLASSISLASANEPLDRIVAVVNHEIILDSDLEERIEALRMRMDPGTQLPPRRVLREQVLEQLINERVQLQRADMAGLRVSDDEVNQALARFAQQQGTTLAELPQLMEGQGMSYASMREQMRQELLQQRVQEQMLYREVTVSEREIQEFLAEAEARGDLDAEYRVSHIMIGMDGSSDDPDVVREARERAENIYEQLQEGADFAELAIAHSESRTALDGGDLGWRPGPELPTAFAERVVDMGAGDVTRPFRTSSGFHILKLNEARRGDPVIVQEHHSRHILLQPSEILLPEQAHLKLVELRRRVVEEGESFADLAREYSQDPGSASLGGDLDWQTFGQFVPEFEEVIEELEPGEVSQPFESRFGHHLVQLIELRERDRTLDVRRNQAQQFIRARKAEERMDAWLQNLRDESYLEIRLGS